MDIAICSPEYEGSPWRPNEPKLGRPPWLLQLSRDDMRLAESLRLMGSEDAPVGLGLAVSLGASPRPCKLEHTDLGC